MKTILVIILIIGIITANLADDPKKYYVFKKARVNFHGAVLGCITRNLQLATINSAAEQSAIEKAMIDVAGEIDDFWISGADLADEGSYIWMSTGRALSYTKWLRGQPDNHNDNEDCIHIWNTVSFAMWNDNFCGARMFYICEDKSTNTTAPA